MLFGKKDGFRKKSSLVAILLVFVLMGLTLGLTGVSASWYDGDDLGYLDYVKVNNSLFEDLDTREIVFYPEDLTNGKVEITGILESEQKDLKPEDLVVQISLNGGKSWQDATGDARWSFVFEPKIGRSYDLSIQVVRRRANTLTPYQLGDFLLKTTTAAVEDRLNGQATIALGWLAQFVPAEFKKPGTDELMLMVSDLQVAGNVITRGSVSFDHDIDFTLAGVGFQLTSLGFSPEGATAEGKITLPPLVLPSAPVLDFRGLTFTKTGMVHDLALIKPSDPVQTIDIISGTHGVALALSELGLHIDTGQSQVVSLTGLDGSIVLGSGYGGVSIPDLKLLENRLLSFGRAAAGDAAARLTIPNTQFVLEDLGGIIDLAQKSVSLSGSFQFPDDLGGGFVSLPGDKPLVLSTQGISTAQKLVFDSDVLPSFVLSGFPTTLTGLDLSILNNIPSGTLAGQVTLTNFANIALGIEADIDKTGLASLQMATVPEGGSYTFDMAGFASLTLSRIALGYENKAFTVDLDGAIIPKNDKISSIQGIGDQLIFKGLSIGENAITLADDLKGWHDITGASAGFEGAAIALSQYGIGVENNLFWVGLKGQASLGGSSALASARIFHDGTTAIDGIDLTNFTFALGDFSLKVARDKIAENGNIPDNTLAHIGGLPDVLINALPSGVLNQANELEVLLKGFKVDLANRSVSLGSVDYTPGTPLEVALGPCALKFEGITFTPSSASIKGGISLDGLGLPIGDLPFTDLYLGRDGIAGEINLIGSQGTRHVTIMEGEYGFGLKLNEFMVQVDTRKETAKMVSLETFGGSLVFGSGFGDLEIPDLQLLADKAISWGKNTAIGAQGTVARLTLPGGLFSMGDLGGALNLSNKSLSLSGTLILPPAMGSASLTIPADKPLTLSAATGLSTSGPLVFDPAALPQLSLAHIDSTLTGLTLGVDRGIIAGSLAANMNFSQFGGLKIAVAAAIDKTGLKDIKIDTGKLSKTLDLAGFARLNLSTVKAGYKNENFYAQIDGDITPTHTLFTEYKKKISFEGLRIFKTGVEFAQNMDGWHNTEDASISINAAKVALKEYGIGVKNQALWFGLKGRASYLNNEVDLTAKIFQDGTFEISDFGFEGLTLALGDFKLTTSAKAVEGLISGEGFINGGFLSEYIPAQMKDPLTGEVKVQFENLGVDLVTKKITSGAVTLDFKDKPLTPKLGILSAKIRSVSFGFDNAAMEGDFSLASLAGIELPDPLTGLSFADIELLPAGFAGSVSYDAKPLSIPVLTGDYGITLALSQLSLAIDTRKSSWSDKVRLTDLDGGITLGSGYDLAQPLTDLRLLADGAITWGVTGVGDMVQNAKQGAKNEAEQLKSGLSFKIPGTSFGVDNINGRLYLNDREMAVWGQVVLPAEFGGGSISLTPQNSLMLSATGVSITGQVSIDPGTLGQGFELAGFGADVSGFSFGVSDNTISGAIDAKIKLALFDNLPIGVRAALGNKGIQTLAVTAEEVNESFTLAGFDLKLTKIGGGYEEGQGFVTLDGSLTLDHDKIKDLGRSFDFNGLTVSPTALSLPDVAQTFKVDGVSFSVGGDALAMSLKEYGFAVEDNLFWVSLGGEVSLLGKSMEAAARLSHTGSFEFDRFGADNLTIAIGDDFTLRGSFEYADGHITKASAGLHLGSLMDSIGSEFKNQFNELPVEVENLDFEMVNGAPVLTNGTITYAPGQAISLTNDLFTASFTSISVGVRNGNVFGDLEGAALDFTSGILAGLEGFSITNIGLTGNGITGDVTYTNATGKAVTVVDHSTHGIKALLTTIGVHFDTSKSQSKMVAINNIQGNLSFGTGYNAPDLAPVIDFDPATNLYGFSATNSALTLVTGLKLKDFSGGINFADESISLAGSLAIPLAQDKEIVLGVKDWKISSQGFEGGLSAKNIDLSESVGFNSIMLTNAAIEFDHFSLASANLDLNVTLKQFFGLQVAAKLAVGSSGVAGWAIDTNAGADLTKSIGFADITVTKLGAGYDSGSGDDPGRGLYFSLDSNVAFTGSGLLSGLGDDLTLSGIEVSGSGIKVNEAAMTASFPGSSAKLAGVDLGLTKLGIGYKQAGENEEGLFYVNAAGELSVGALMADADVKLYQTMDIELNQITLAYTEGPVSFGGTLTLTEGKFGADVKADVAGVMKMDGSFVMGSEDTYSYWGVSITAGGGSGIPLGAIPLSLYEVGGGFAYHMTVDSATGKLTEDGDNPFVLSAMVGLGTADATTWYGKFNLHVEMSKLTLSGDSWFFSETHSGTADLEADISIGTSPAMFHVSARASLEKKLGSLTMLGVNGEMDMLFAEGDWHIWFGSQDQRLNLTALEYLTGSGYLQLSSDGLAVGVRQTFDIGGKAWIFYGRVYGGAEVSIEGGFAPFYIDAKGRIWVGLEAGVRVSGENYEIISAHAELAARFRAPNPTFVMMHGEMRYSFLGGIISGSWEMDFTIPKGAEGASMDADISTVPLLASVTPQQGATKVGLVSEFEIRTTMPLMNPFRYEDNQWYVLGVKTLNHPNDIVDFTQQASGNNNAVLFNGNWDSLAGGLAGSRSLRYRTYLPLTPGREYTLDTTLVLRRFTPDRSVVYKGLRGVVGGIVKEEPVQVGFTATPNEITDIRETIMGVYPTQSTTPVYPETPVYFEMNNPAAAVMARILQTTGVHRIELIDPRGQAVAGQWKWGNIVTNELGGTQRYLFDFKPDRPLDLFKSFTNYLGEKQYVTQRSDGKWINPFTVPKAAAEEDSGDESQSSGVRTQKGLKDASRAGIVRAGTPVGTSVGTVGTPMQQNNGPMQPNQGSVVQTSPSVGAVTLGDQTPNPKRNFQEAWENKYTLEIFDTRENKRLYGSRFFLTLPKEEDSLAAFADTAEVVSQGGISNVHFYANYSIDQGAYQQAVFETYKEILPQGRCEIWEGLKAGEYAITPDYDHLCSMNDKIMVPDWRRAYTCYDQSNSPGAGSILVGQVLEHSQRIDEELNKCAPTAAARAALEIQLDTFKEEQAAVLSTVDFRSIELRFTTAAPINWNEIELEVTLGPNFNGEVKWSLPTQAQAMHNAVCGSGQSSARLKYGKHSWRCTDPIPSHEARLFPDLVLSKGGYVIKSPPGGLEHRLELKLKDIELYASGDFLRLMDLYKGAGASLARIGEVRIYEQVVETSTSGGTFNLGRGSLLDVGIIKDLKSTRPAGSGFQSENHRGASDDSDLCHVCD